MNAVPMIWSPALKNTLPKGRSFFSTERGPSTGTHSLFLISQS